jgi:hypothetical protein
MATIIPIPASTDNSIGFLREGRDAVLVHPGHELHGSIVAFVTLPAWKNAS